MARISRRVMGTPLNGQRETELHIVYSASTRPLFQHCGGTRQEHQVQVGRNGCVELGQAAGGGSSLVTTESFMGYRREKG